MTDVTTSRDQKPAELSASGSQLSGTFRVTTVVCRVTFPPSSKTPPPAEAVFAVTRLPCRVRSPWLARPPPAAVELWEIVVPLMVAVGFGPLATAPPASAAELSISTLPLTVSTPEP